MPKKLYRSDGRIVVKLKDTGFEAQNKMSLAQARNYLRDEYLGQNATRDLASHIWGSGGNPRLISMGTDEDCAGQTAGEVRQVRD